MFTPSYFAPRYFAPRYFASGVVYADLLEAIVARLLGDGDVSGSVGSRVYFGLARGNTPFPYVTLRQIGTRRHWTAGGKYLEDVIVQISVFGEAGVSDVSEMGRTIADALIPTPYTFTNGVCQSALPGSTVILEDPAPSKSGRAIYQDATDWTFTVGRELS